MIDTNHHTHYKEFLSPIECESLSLLAIEDERRVMDIDNPYKHWTAYTGLTGQHMVYNWLSHPTVECLNIPQRLFNLPFFDNSVFASLTFNLVSLIGGIPLTP